MDDSERIWREDQERYGWTLPRAAAWPLRLPVVRNIRVAILSIKVERFAAGWNSIGIGVGGVPQYDRWVLYAISRGWC